MNNKDRKISKNLDESEDSFYVTLRGGPESNNSFTTEFTNKLFKPLYLKGEYEVALTNIYFSNVQDMDLGQIEISFNNDNWNYVILLKVEAKMGDHLKLIFDRINDKIHEMVKEQEFKRRLHLRRHNRVDNSEQLFRYGEHIISLPISTNPIYDEFVNEEIKMITPKIIFASDHLTFETTSEFSFKFHGNILNVIPELKNEKFDGKCDPILIRNSYLPSFETLFITSNILVPENFGDSKELEILKIINLEKNSRIQSISIGNNDLTFQRLKSIKHNINHHTKINEIGVSIFSDLNEKLKINQGEVILRFYFRKI